MKTIDGTNWIQQSSGTTNSLYAVHFINDKIGTAVGTEKILATIDGGDNWLNLPPIISVDLYDVNFTDEANGWATGQSGKIFNTDNNGGLTAAKEIEEHVKNFKLYPNPARNFIRIDFELAKSDNLQIQIKDLTGKLIESVLKENFSAGKQQITFKTNHLKEGTYLIDINNLNKHFSTQLFIKE